MVDVWLVMVPANCRACDEYAEPSVRSAWLTEAGANAGVQRVNRTEGRRAESVTAFAQKHEATDEPEVDGSCTWCGGWVGEPEAEPLRDDEFLPRHAGIER